MVEDSWSQQMLKIERKEKLRFSLCMIITHLMCFLWCIWNCESCLAQHHNQGFESCENHLDLDSWAIITYSYSRDSMKWENNLRHKLEKPL